MSLVGTAIGRMAYGAGQVANKYIDQEIETQKAEAIAAIQRASAIKMDEYSNSPERRGRMREAAGADLVSNAAATDRAALATATDDRLNTALNAVAGSRAGAVARATAQNTAHNVSPGNKVIIGEGENTNKTAAQWTYDAYKEQIRGAQKEERDRATEAYLNGINTQIREIEGSIAKGMADGMLSPNAPTDGKPSDAHDRLKYLEAQRSRLEQARALIIASTRKAGGVSIPGLDDAPPTKPPVNPDAPGAADERMKGRRTKEEVAPPSGVVDAVKGAVGGAAGNIADTLRYHFGDGPDPSGKPLVDAAKNRAKAPDVTPEEIAKMPMPEVYKFWHKHSGSLTPEQERALIKRTSSGQ